MVIKVDEVVQVIKSKFSSSEVEVADKGVAPGFDNKIRRFIISTVLFGAEIQFNLGENLMFKINGSPIRVIKHLPLANENHVKRKVSNWLKKNRTFS